MTNFPETSETLIARVKNLGDVDSWSEFVGIYQPTILRMAKRRGLQDADALDVAQQILISVANSISSWSPDLGAPPFRATLSCIVSSEILRSRFVKSIPRYPTGSSISSPSFYRKILAIDMSLPNRSQPCLKTVWPTSSNQPQNRCRLFYQSIPPARGDGSLLCQS